MPHERVGSGPLSGSAVLRALSLIALLVVVSLPGESQADEPAPSPHPDPPGVRPAMISLVVLGLVSGAIALPMGFVSNDQLTRAVADPKNGCRVKDDDITCRDYRDVDSARRLEAGAIGVGATGAAALIAAYTVAMVFPAPKARNKAWLRPAAPPMADRGAIGFAVTF